MKEKISIRLKAALLLIVFSLNTIIGFACAVGVDMNFNSKHHEEKQQLQTAIHVHANGQQHQHHKKITTHSPQQKKSAKKNGCCNKKIIKIQTAEKFISAKQIFDSPVFVAISSFLSINLMDIINSFPPKNIKRYFYPPPPDILLSIQKFQV